jgi:Coenzyme PQQ synthesis protein D (PqqD)
MSRFVHSDSVVSRVIADETLIVPVRRGVGDLASIYSLNPVASAIWQAISQPRSRSEIVQLIEEEFEAQPEIVSCDVDSFLAEMTAAGLVNTAGVAA